MVDIKTIVEQLCDTYYLDETWHHKRMNPEDAYAYHLHHIENGSIRVYQEMGVVLGYYQLFKVNKEQAQRLVAKLPFNENIEDIKSGNIAYVHNLWVDKAFRKGRIFREMLKMWREDTKDCTMTMGLEQKYRERVRVYPLKRS